MSGISNHVSFYSPYVDTVADLHAGGSVTTTSGCYQYPKGALIEVSINPYTGKVVFAWQDNAKARPYIAAILDELNSVKFFDLINPVSDRSCDIDRPDLGLHMFEHYTPEGEPTYASAVSA